MRAMLFPVFMLAMLAIVMQASAQDKAKSYPELPSETPAKFKPVTDSFDHTRRNVMIPMRDGVKLHTVILVPKGAKKEHPGDHHPGEPTRRSQRDTASR